MIFPHSFYEDEIRCDYLVPSMVKRTWAAQIEILSDVDRACRSNGLSYFAEWGTLLGTVRHAGFIPWDDDMDICMKRSDYNRFISDAATLVSPDHSIVNYRSNREFKQMLSRIVSSDHYRFDKEYMHKYSGLPIALGIDIFPLDYLTDDDEYEKDREERVNLVYDTANEIAYYGTDPSMLGGQLRRIEERCKVKLDRRGDILTQLRELLEKLFAEVDEKGARYITLYPLWLDDHSFVFPKEYYDNSIRLPFENTTVPVPVGYDGILKKKYGSSYMTPVRSGGAHEYPYFENHVNILREHFGFEWPSYKFCPADLPAGTGKAEGDDGSALFITYCSEGFSNMISLVEKYIDEGRDVTILPVAAFDIEPDMSAIGAAPPIDDEIFEGIEGARITHDPAVLNGQFHTIVTNYPYDEYNLITAVDKMFYSVSLKQRCDKLVYVPPFEARSIKAEDERARKLMPLYVCTKLATVCDEIVLHSNEMKERYVETLTAFSGDGYREVWDNKITVLISDDPGREAMPGKKKILFYVGLGSFAEYGAKTIDKIKSVFETFEENADRIDAVYLMQEGLLDNLKEIYPGLYEKYMACDFRESVNDVSTDDMDAYYGEASRYATELINSTKPVMVWNADTGGNLNGSR